MRHILVFLLLASPLFAQKPPKLTIKQMLEKGCGPGFVITGSAGPGTKNDMHCEAGEVGEVGVKPHKPYVAPPSPMQRMKPVRAHSAVAEIPAQGFMSKLVHGEQWKTVHVAFPEKERCFPVGRIPIFWADEMLGRYTEIKLDNPSGNGVDVSAPEGRTIFINWSCRP